MLAVSVSARSGEIWAENHLNGPDGCIKPADIVEEAEIIDHLEDQNRDCTSQSRKICPLDPKANSSAEHGLLSNKERLDLQPCNDVV